MDWLKPYLVSRVRLAALGAMVEAGGEPSTAALVRALKPVLADLLPLPAGPLASAADRRKALQRFLELTGEDARRTDLVASRPRRPAGRADLKL